MLIIQASAEVGVECDCGATEDTHFEIEDAGDFTAIPDRAIRYFQSLGWECDDDTLGICPICKEDN